jgi:hypothetical protein
VNTPPPPEGAAPSTPAPDPPAPPDPPVAPPLSDAERARAFSTFRGTALACVLLGLVMLPAAFTDTDRPELRQALALVPARTPLGAMLRATLDFAATAGPTIGVWASVLVGAGGVALVRFSVGRRLLVLAAWLTLAAMVALAFVWSAVCRRHGLGARVEILGWILHALQSLLVIPALRRLTAPSLADTLAEAERRLAARR